MLETIKAQTLSLNGSVVTGESATKTLPPVGQNLALPQNND